MKQINNYEQFEEMYPCVSTHPKSHRPTSYPCFGKVVEPDAELFSSSVFPKMGYSRYVELVYPPAGCHLESFMMGLNAR